MATSGMPTRKQYRIDDVEVSVTSTRIPATRVKIAVTVPAIPSRPVGERELIQFIKSLRAPAIAGAQILAEAEAQAKRTAPPDELPAQERISLIVRGVVVAPQRDATLIVLGSAKGDGSSRVHRIALTPPIPENPAQMSRPRSGLPR